MSNVPIISNANSLYPVNDGRDPRKKPDERKNILTRIFFLRLAIRGSLSQQRGEKERKRKRAKVGIENFFFQTK